VPMMMAIMVIMMGIKAVLLLFLNFIVVYKLQKPRLIGGWD